MSDQPQDTPGYLDYARRVMRTARLAFDDGDWVSAINRAYYAIFYAANAMLELEGSERSKHSGVLALFRQKYIKTGKIGVEFSDIYGEAFEARNKGDYEMVVALHRVQAEKAIESARRFVERIEKYLADTK